MRLVAPWMIQNCLANNSYLRSPCVLWFRERSRPSLIMVIQSLIEENHCYLASLGVSHDTLELIRSKCSESPYKLSTKLTGAGGGGCTVTLVPDGMYCELYF